METPTLNKEQRQQAFILLLPAVTISKDPNAEFITTALTSVKVRDALLKALTELNLVTKTIAHDRLFSIGTDTYGEVITDWSADLLGTLAGISMLQNQPNEAKMYAQAGADKGNNLSQLIWRALTHIPPAEACKIFTDSINAVTLDDCLED